jgi:hypothetical protein
MWGDDCQLFYLLGVIIHQRIKKIWREDRSFCEAFVGLYHCNRLSTKMTTSWNIIIWGTLHPAATGYSYVTHGRSQWPWGQRHELPLLARTLGWWVRILLKAWMSVRCVSLCVYAILCVGTGLAISWSSVQGDVPTVYRIIKLKKRPRPKKNHNSN